MLVRGGFKLIPTVLSKLAGLKFGEPYSTVGINLNPPRTSIRRRRTPFRHLQSFCIHFPDFSIRDILRKPAIAVLVESESISRGNFLELSERFRFRIKNGQRPSGRPYSAEGIDSQGVLGSACYGSFLAGNVWILKFRNRTGARVPTSNSV